MIQVLVVKASTKEFIVEETGEMQERSITKISGMILKKVITQTKEISIMIRNLQKIKMLIKENYHTGY